MIKLIEEIRDVSNVIEVDQVEVTECWWRWLIKISNLIAAVSSLSYLDG